MVCPYIRQEDYQFDLRKISSSLFLHVLCSLKIGILHFLDILKNFIITNTTICHYHHLNLSLLSSQPPPSAIIITTICHYYHDNHHYLSLSCITTTTICHYHHHHSHHYLSCEVCSRCFWQWSFAAEIGPKPLEFADNENWKKETAVFTSISGEGCYTRADIP